MSGEKRFIPEKLANGRIANKIKGSSSRLRYLSSGTIAFFGIFFILWIGLFATVYSAEQGTVFGEPDYEIDGMIINYPNGTTKALWQPNLLNITTGTYIFRIHAVNGTHGFQVDEFPSSKTGSIFSGQSKDVRISFPQPGTFEFRCTFFCDITHDFMTGTIIVT
ncbi:MAG: cytochrome c oxidase subunit 2 [Candidatus Heimdallarchaeota archaeon LC_3]|nr:MAG: cytochrome c oxidase subunit 2 [Candidatus Heimdallarchaeota archaeon LC_3]